MAKLACAMLAKQIAQTAPVGITVLLVVLVLTN